MSTVTRPAKTENAIRPESTRFARAENESKPKIDREGGQYESGIIRDVAVITRGEALGHGVWIDSTMLDQVAELGNEQENGIKARFTHPGMSSDGLGKMLGRVQDFRIDGDQVLGDLHFSESSHKTPDGDLAEYVMLLTEEDASAAGLSIVFEQDFDATEMFTDYNTGDDGDFISPDDLNVDGLPHARVLNLRAADVVDEPAANPTGMFYRQDLPAEAFAFFNFASGISDDKPGALLGIEPGRAREFFQRWKTENDVSITLNAPQESPTMTDKNENQAPENEPTESSSRESILAELARFSEAFGNANGVEWFNQGLEFGEALAKHCVELSKQIDDREAKIAELEGKLESVDLGEPNPVDVPSDNDAEKVEFESLFSIRGDVSKN